MFRFKTKRILLSAVVVVIVFFSVYPWMDTYGLKSSNQLESYFDQNIKELMKEYEIPGLSIAIIEEGKIRWSKAYGYANVENKQKMTLDTIYRAESISKSVTAWGVMNLVEEGKLDLDQPVESYLKNWHFPQSEYSVKDITVRGLLSQSSGMPLGTIGEEYPPGSPMPTLKEYLTKEARLFQEPGKSFSYSNVGYNLLELLVEEVTGMEFADYMKKEVLNPLGMYDSYFNLNNKIEKALAVGYDVNGIPVQTYVYPANASGGLYSTIEDLAGFVAEGMTSRYKQADHVLTQNSIQQLYNKEIKPSGLYSLVSTSYGLGHFIETAPNGQKVVFSGGQGHGWMTHIHFAPDQGSGIVILTNSQRSWPVISSILADWAKWSDIDSVGMGRIIQVEFFIRLLTGFLLLVSLITIVNIIIGITYKKFVFLPIVSVVKSLRILQVVFGASLLAYLLWCLQQDYVFITSVFPTSYKSLGLSVFAFAVSLIISALLTKQTKKGRNSDPRTAAK